jgi:hypothetical protein
MMKGVAMVVMDYRTQDGLAHYGFSIEFQPDRGWRVYILFDSFRKGQNDGPQSPYDALDNDGRRYVDWRSKLDSPADARAVAELWAELVHGDQRAQEEHNLYIELIQQYMRTEGKKGDSDETAKGDPDSFSRPRTDAA